MTKIKFLMLLHDQLSDFPQNEVEERLSFYSEMIEDRMEEGLSEEEAVAAVGSVDQIAAQIAEDLKKPAVKKQKKKWNGLQIIFFVLSFPIWLPLVITCVSVGFSLYVVLWAVIVSLWSAYAAVAGSAVGCTFGGCIIACGGNVPSGFALISAGLVCAGLSIFLFYGCMAATKGAKKLTGFLSSGIKRCFIRKEAA